MVRSRLLIFFKQNRFITSKRSELYGWIDFLTNCGGSLGLFMGVSLLSIVEIFYYCTVRLCCKLNEIRQKKYKSTAKELNSISCHIIDEEIDIMTKKLPKIVKLKN